MFLRYLSRKQVNVTETFNSRIQIRVSIHLKKDHPLQLMTFDSILSFPKTEKYRGILQDTTLKSIKEYGHLNLC